MKFKDTKYGDLTGQTYKGDIDVSNLKLTSLEGAPKKVHGYFWCYDNENLTSLKGAPETVGGNFGCYNNQLKSLEGSPRSVKGSFTCFYNSRLKSLGGAPSIVGGYFDCSSNPELTQNDIWGLLDSDIKGEIIIPEGLKAPTEDDYKLYNKLHKNINKFIKLKSLKDKLI